MYIVVCVQRASPSINYTNMKVDFHTLLETKVSGIFAEGDVRAGAMSRVASAVGENAMTIKFVHEYLQTS